MDKADYTLRGSDKTGHPSDWTKRLRNRDAGNLPSRDEPSLNDEYELNEFVLYPSASGFDKMVAEYSIALDGSPDSMLKSIDDELASLNMQTHLTEDDLFQIDNLLAIKTRIVLEDHARLHPRFVAQIGKVLEDENELRAEQGLPELSDKVILRNFKQEVVEEVNSTELDSSTDQKMAEFIRSIELFIAQRSAEEKLEASKKLRMVDYDQAA